MADTSRRGARGLGGWRLGVYLAGLWLPLAAVLLGAKLSKLATLSPSDWWADLPAVISQDLGLLSLLSLLLWPAALSKSRAGRAATLCALHVLLPLAAATAFAEHSFFRITGALADWFILQDGLLRFRSLMGLYASELTMSRAVGLLSPWLLSALWWLVGSALARHPQQGMTGERGTGWGPRYRAALVVATLATLVGPWLPVSDGAAALRRDVLAGIVADATRQMFSRGAKRVDDRNQGRAPGPARLRPLEGAASSATPARNLVIVAMESTGALYSSVYENAPYDSVSRPTMPRLRALARRGLTVQRAYTVIPHTSKAMVALMCGYYPRVSPWIAEATYRGLPAPCLARLLSEQGFATAFFQPAEEQYERRAQLVEELGFRHFEGKESLPGRGFDESNYFGWEDDAMLKPALRWVDQQAGQRFLLSVLTLTAHHPYAVPRGFPSHKDTGKVELDDYLATLRYTDRFVSRLVEALRTRGLLDETLIVLVGDHGEGFGQHGRQQHDAVIYEEGLRVPMVLIGPGLEPGSSAEGLRQLIDVAPTVTRLLGFQGDRPFFGRDLQRSKGHEELFTSCHYKDYCAALIGPRYKYIYHFDRSPAQVFDLELDPLEKKPLDAPSQQAAGLDLQGAIARMRRLQAANNSIYDRQAQARLPRFVQRGDTGDTGNPLRVLFAPPKPGGAQAPSLAITALDVDPPQIVAGGSATVTTRYQVLRRPPPSWRTFHHMRGPAFRNLDHAPVQGAYPLSRWRVGDEIEDRYVLTTRPDSSPGTYRIQTGIWDRKAKKRIAPRLLRGKARAAPGLIEAGTLTIRQAEIDPKDFVRGQAPADAGLALLFGDLFTLRAASLDRKRSKPGLKFNARYVFEALKQPPTNLQLRVELEGPTPRVIQHVPVFGRLPPGRWQPGQFILDNQAIITRTRDRLGRYTLWLSAIDEQTGEPLAVTGTGLPVVDDRVRVGQILLGK